MRDLLLAGAIPSGVDGDDPLRPPRAAFAQRPKIREGGQLGRHEKNRWSIVTTATSPRPSTVLLRRSIPANACDEALREAR